MSPRFYTFLFKIWHWYALRVLRIPFAVSYTPPPNHDILGMTYAWTKDYTDRIMRGFEALERVNELEHELEQARRVIAAQRSGDEK